MPITLHGFVGLYDRVLGSLSHILDKGEAYAGEKGISTDEMLDWKLIDDMAPLRFQAMVVINFTRSWTARVAGQLAPQQLDGREEEPLTVQPGDTMEPTLPAGQRLSVFATTNIYFHLSIAYAILRMKGVPIGKADLFAGRL